MARIILANLAWLAALLSPWADACDCQIPEVAAAIEKSAAVFSGEVAGVETFGSSISARFRVERIWKGPVVATVDVITELSEVACGVPFHAGERYIVYADFRDPREPMCELLYLFLETDLCTRTRLFEEGEASRLGEPKWTAPPAAFRRGDVNGDRQFDISDPVGILLHLFGTGPGSDCGDVMDINDSGAVDLSDAIYGLSSLFTGGPGPPAPGPHVPGFDPTTGDRFACGDASVFPCGFESSSTLPGVRIEIVEGPCRLNLAQAGGGVHFTYRVVVERDLPGVTSRQLATCQQPGPRGLLLLPRIHGDEQRQVYCLCDLGKCFRQDHSTDLVSGSDAATFTWCGRNWTGPSDFGNPLGPPFPPGRYRFEVRGEGNRVDEAGSERAFELLAAYEFELVRSR